MKADETLPAVVGALIFAALAGIAGSLSWGLLYLSSLTPNPTEAVLLMAGMFFAFVMLIPLAGSVYCVVCVVQALWGQK